MVKWKTEAQAIFFILFHLPFVHRANRSLFFVHLLTEKQTEVIHLQRD
jgi:hypothetical protein